MAALLSAMLGACTLDLEERHIEAAIDLTVMDLPRAGESWEMLAVRAHWEFERLGRPVEQADLGDQWGGVTLQSVTLVEDPNNVLLLRHELTHARQWDQWGNEDFVQRWLDPRWRWVIEVQGERQVVIDLACRDSLGAALHYIELQEWDGYGFEDGARELMRNILIDTAHEFEIGVHRLCPMEARYACPVGVENAGCL